MTHNKSHGGCSERNPCNHHHSLNFSQSRTILGAGDLSQDLERSGLGGAGAWAPVLRVLGYALPAGISMSGHMVKMDICVHDVFPGHSGGTGRMTSANILLI